MQKIAIPNLQPNMVVARNIFSPDGVLLLSADTVLNPSQIDRLQQFGLTSIYIKNPFTDNLNDSDLFDTIPEVVREETRVQAIQIVNTSFQNLAITQELNTQPFQEISDFLLEEVIKNRGAMIHLTDIRARDGYTFGHSVNVCVLATLTGLQMGYDLGKLKELALGALLHDTGKMLVPKELLIKPGPLTCAERKLMERHPDLGFNVLRTQRDIPLVSAHIAYQHHEKFDGTGYTRSLCGTEIHEYARIVAIADVYDALTSDRPYKEGTLPHEAYEIMMSLASTHFDPAILRIFLNQIAVYPLDSIVQLNTGDIAVVIGVTPGLQTRPTLKILVNADGCRLADGPEIDLTKNLTTFIHKVFTSTELLHLDARTSSKHCRRQQPTDMYLKKNFQPNS
ncbi:HD-GYP domain-containing protein [Sporomusa acidovorans]|uniref:HD-GYP domain-containing protein n=1 Tax=Sporomusa acidovorans (strain ATCC 49682 / DSM 3132 / Mol) TaxID=1123286 RepID=A0ABZ3J861_SPOA4|nr:HD-GYP domain-containing protein [Sporomusa acidovorans]OZC21207.1 cyclic di-GMP phosphodiesterase response regulator RpfG [Sporomusa acidovorans DSM 3132]SDE64735.1 metal dependent phosphohydrolase [Sporomusa acidovorans]